MKKFLIVYLSRTGKTKAMAEFIAEGIRIAGHQADVKVLPQVKDAEALKGYDGYIFGSPTYHKDMVLGMKNWLFTVHKAGLAGKIGGAFGSHTHSGEAPTIIYDTMANVFKMNMEDMGPLRMEEKYIGTDEGLHTCQQFGKALASRA